MQNRYTGDIGDFGKFLLLKHLFPTKSITTIWYLYPDETHNSDGSHTVKEGNVKVYRRCHTLDPQMSELFNTIHRSSMRHIDLFETLDVLENGHYFTESILGEGKDYRRTWCDRAMNFIRHNHCDVVCLDPDNGIEPSSMTKLSTFKQGKYATLEEIEMFFDLDCVNHLVIYQHFHRQQSHEMQMKDTKAKFERLYEGRAVVTIIRHNPVQARFYILLSKRALDTASMKSLLSIYYGTKTFFSEGV